MEQESQVSNGEVPNLFGTEEQQPQAAEAGQQKSPEEVAKLQEQERLAAKFAEAAKRNAALRAKQREIKAPLQEKDSKIQQLEAELARLKKYEEVEDPMELLNLRGIKYEDLIARNLNPEAFDQKTEFKKVMDEVSSLKAELARRDEEAKKREEESVSKQAEEGKAQYLEHLRSFTEKNLDKYELIHAFQAHEDVYDVIAETYRHTSSMGEPKLLSDDEAAAIVEKVLEDSYLDRFTKINKIRNKIAPIKEDKQPADLFKQPATLTNQLTPQTTARKQRMSDEEAIRQAASLIKWENN